MQCYAYVTVEWSGESGSHWRDIVVDIDLPASPLVEDVTAKINGAVVLWQGQSDVGSDTVPWTPGTVNFVVSWVLRGLFCE